MIKKTIKCMGAKVLKGLGITDRFEAQNKSILILMYHRVNTDPNCLGLTVPPELFSNQLKYLKDNYELISLSDAVSRISSGEVKGNSCVITFDDGYRDNYQFAAPLLANHNIPATIFVTFDAIQSGHFGWGAFDRALLSTELKELDLQHFGLGRYSLDSQKVREKAVVTLHRLLKQKPDTEKQAVVDHVVTTCGGGILGERIMMNWAEVNELANSGMVTIGAHTISHPILSRVTLAKARHEIIEGKRLIEQKLDVEVNYFAYPNGQPADIGQEVVQLVREAGYLGACTTIAGRNPAGSDPLYLKRVDVTKDMSTNNNGKFSPELFSTMTSGFFCR